MLAPHARASPGPALARACAVLAACLAAAGAPAVQEPAADDATSGAAAGPQVPDLAQRRGELADRARAERSAGRFDEALRDFAAARDLAEESRDFQAQILLEIEIVRTHAAAGRLEEQLRTDALIEERLADHEGDAEFVAEAAVCARADAALVLVQLGRAHDALAKARQAVDRAEDTRDPGARALGWNSLGWALWAVGRLAEAPACFRRADAELFDFELTVPPRAEIALNLAECLGELGDTAGALERVESVLFEMEARGTADPLLSSRAYSVRGVQHFYTDWAAAEADLRHASELLRTAGRPEGDGRRLLADFYLAHAVRNRGRPAESAALERATLETAAKHLGPAHPIRSLGTKLLAASLSDLGQATGDRARYEESRALYQAAAELARASGNPDAYTVYSSLGMLLLDRFDDPVAAEPWLREAVDEIEEASGRALALDEATRAGLFRQRRFHKRFDPYESLLRCLLRLSRPEDALRVLELSRARGLRDLLDRSRFDPVAEARQRAEAAGDARAVERLDALPREIDAALAEAATARAAFSPGQENPHIAKALERVRALCVERAELTQAVTESAAPVELGILRRALRDGEALLGYFLGRFESFVCLAEGPGGAVTWFPLKDEQGQPLTAPAIARDVEALVGALSRARSDPARGAPVAGTNPMAADSRRLSETLFRRLMPADLWERVRDRPRVHLLPHGPLNRLPFEALISHPASDGRAASYWLDEGPPIAYHESGSALVWGQRRREAQERAQGAVDALVVADPDYSDAASAAEVRPPEPGQGLLVARVRSGGRAARAGLLAGDVLRSYAGTPIDTPARLASTWRARTDRQPGEVIVLRAGSERRLRIETGDPEIEIASERILRGSTVDPAPAGPALARLAGAGREADAVAGALRAWWQASSRSDGAVRVFTGAEATETLLTSWASRAVIIHVAAHQIEDPYGRWEAGRLALVPPPVPTAEDDGFVDLDDLLLRWRGRLEHCQLMVFSSCRSRTGKLEDDEGFYGLPLGFRYAGCPSIVASLWPVDDSATAEMMTIFYRALGELKGRDRLQAFTDARRELKRERPDPFDWAPFVWTGAPW